MLTAAAFAPVGKPFALVFGFALFLISLRGASPRAGLVLGLLYGYTLFAVTLWWMWTIFGPAAITLWAISTLFPMAFGLLYTWLRIRLPRLAPALLAPILWTATEFFRSEPMRPNFGWIGFGYGLIETPGFAWIAPLAGSYAITFGVVLLAVMLAEAAQPSVLGRRRRILAACAALALWTAGFLVPPRADHIASPLRVRLVQASAGDLDTQVSLSRLAAGSRCDVIVWSEYSSVLDPYRIALRGHRIPQVDVARANHAMLLFGAEEQPNLRKPGYYNTAYLLDRDGRLLGTHRKNHPVHFFEDGWASRIARPIDSPVGRIGVAICFDMDYPDVARRLAAEGARVFLVPNMDPGYWGAVQRRGHRLMFEMRAAECGRWLARADVAGGTSVVDPFGRQVRHVSTSGPCSIDAVVGLESSTTPYVRGGWRFGQACLVVAMLLLLAGLRSHLIASGSRNPPA
jgi:apolipoprotein N-acyltransferase